MQTPYDEGVLVMSSGCLSPDHLISKILDSEILPKPFMYENCTKVYPWDIDTKYYTAQVNLFAAEKLVEFNEELSEKIQAIIFYFDFHEPSSFKNILNWIPSLSNIKPEVQLLLCDSCDDDNIPESQKKYILNWCIENQYELIELNPAIHSDEEEDDIIEDPKGYHRVIQALQSHTWSNMIMKDAKKESHEVSDKNEKALSSSPSSSSCSSQQTKKTDTTKTVKVDEEELLLEEQWLQNVLGQDDPGGESFESLFSKFASMKEKASGLSGDQRKKYAEKVAIAFWRAMGGEEDEIEGLDD